VSDHGGLTPVLERRYNRAIAPQNPETDGQALTIYNGYAHIYDASGQIAFSEQMIPYLRRLLERHPVRQRRMLDLACGTGTVAIAMALQGWQVTGVDASPHMLEQARAKAEAIGQEHLDNRLRWMQADMRRFRVREPVSLVTCLYDSLNYMLSSDDLQAVFRHVSAALEPGGLFLFDMNTAYALENYWEGQTYMTDTPDLTVVMASEHDYDLHRSTVTVTCFEREGDVYRKYIETHVEQAYPQEHVATLLSDVGLSVVNAYACFTFSPPEFDTTRILWVAQKPGGTDWQGMQGDE
jgi:SAM-dependent methyltransferase